MLTKKCVDEAKSLAEGRRSSQVFDRRLTPLIQGVAVFDELESLAGKRHWTGFHHNIELTCR
jgi:hypothetical protein